MLNLDGVELVSWDVDGTLYDMPRVKRAVIRAALLGLFSVRVVRNVREMRMLGRFRKAMARVRSSGGVLGADGIPANRDAILAAEERWYGPAIGKVGLQPGVLELIEHFQTAGLRQIVVSDYRSEYKLARLGLQGRFEHAYAGETLGHLKPSAELFRRVVAEQGVAPERVLHIGDREDTDGVAAREVGCRVAILGAEFPSPRHLLRTVEKKLVRGATGSE